MNDAALIGCLLGTAVGSLAIYVGNPQDQSQWWRAGVIGIVLSIVIAMVV